MRKKAGTMKRDAVQENAHMGSSGFGILIFLYQIKGNYASFIVKEKYRNSEMQSLTYKENRKPLSERRHEQ